MHNGEDSGSAEWAKINAEYSTRATVNQKQMQTLEMLYAKRDTTQNLIDQAQTTSENTMSSLKGLIGILQSMIQSMRTIMQTKGS